MKQKDRHVTGSVPYGAFVRFFVLFSESLDLFYVTRILLIKLIIPIILKDNLAILTDFCVAQ